MPTNILFPIGNESDIHFIGESDTWKCERNFQAHQNDYSLADFAHVLNVGLNTNEFSEQLDYEGIKARLLKYLRPI